MPGSGSQPTFRRGGTNPRIGQGFTRKGMNAVRGSYPRYNSGGGTGGAANLPAAPVLDSIEPADTSIVLTWSAPATDGGSPIIGYEIWRSETTGEEELLTQAGDELTFEDDTVEADTEYFYKVAAVNRRGTGPLSNELSSTEADAPGAPTSLSVTAGALETDLTWVAPVSDGGSAITGYEIWRSITTNTETLHDTVGVVLAYNDTDNVLALTHYYYKVKAVNAIGAGAFSNEDDDTTDA